MICDYEILKWVSHFLKRGVPRKIIKTIKQTCFQIVFIVLTLSPSVKCQWVSKTMQHVIKIGIRDLLSAYCLKIFNFFAEIFPRELSVTWCTTFVRVSHLSSTTLLNMGVIPTGSHGLPFSNIIIRFLNSFFVFIFIFVDFFALIRIGFT